jgi:cytidylate kinase
MMAHPQGLTVCISREAGARGSSIARRVGEILGWQVYDPELLGYLAQNDAARQEVFAEIPRQALAWAEAQQREIAADQHLILGSDSTQLTQLILALAARGEAIIVGRGAGAILPPETTLNVRIVAPLSERIAYMSQWLRLSLAEATEEVQARDRIRTALHAGLANRDPADLTQYDLIINSGRLGEAGAAELIAEAIRGKHLPSDPFATPSDLTFMEPV